MKSLWLVFITSKVTYNGFNCCENEDPFIDVDLSNCGNDLEDFTGTPSSHQRENFNAYTLDNSRNVVCL